MLLVDDDPDLRFAVARLLSHAGHEVVGEAGDGETGIELATGLQPDVVVLDLRMPGLDGYQALPALIRRCPWSMVVVLSGLDGEADREALLANGAFAYYDKSQLPHLPTLLRTDREEFEAALNGEDTIPPWRRGF